jgi:hypothetical protein
MTSSPVCSSSVQIAKASTSPTSSVRRYGLPRLSSPPPAFYFACPAAEKGRALTCLLLLRDDAVEDLRAAVIVAVVRV